MDGINYYNISAWKTFCLRVIFVAKQAYKKPYQFWIYGVVLSKFAQNSSILIIFMSQWCYSRTYQKIDSNCSEYKDKSICTCCANALRASHLMGSAHEWVRGVCFGLCLWWATYRWIYRDYMTQWINDICDAGHPWIVNAKSIHASLCSLNNNYIFMMNFIGAHKK